MRVYVTSSWRNQRQQDVVRALRDAGHEVYDFRNPAPGDQGFGWRQVAATPEALRDPRAYRDEVLAHPRARASFATDMSALLAAEATVLVLPCGRSAHLELGFATGHGQRTLVLLDDPVSEPELMYLMNSAICVSLDEVIATLKRPGGGGSAPPTARQVRAWKNGPASESTQRRAVQASVRGCAAKRAAAKLDEVLGPVDGEES